MSRGQRKGGCLQFAQFLKMHNEPFGHPFVGFKDIPVFILFREPCHADKLVRRSFDSLRSLRITFCNHISV